MIIALSVFTVSVCVFNAGCGPKQIPTYFGEHIDFYTEAYNSFATKGYSWSGEFLMQVAIVPIETDSYGRALFCYADSYPRSETDDLFFTVRNYALLICQFSTENEVYYYQDYNFINKEAQKENGIKLMTSNAAQKLPSKYFSTIDDPLYGFNEEDIKKLKEWNDWGLPINESKCISTVLNNCFSSYYDNHYETAKTNVSNISNAPWGSIISVDKFGNLMIKGIERNNDNNQDYKEFIYIVSKTYNHLENNYKFTLIDKYENLYLLTAPDYAYQEALKKLRADNYWNVCDLDEVIAQQTSSS